MWAGEGVSQAALSPYKAWSRERERTVGALLRTVRIWGRRQDPEPGGP